MQQIKGAKYALIATFFFALLNAGVKFVGPTVPTVEVVFWRFLIPLIVISALLPAKQRAVRTELFKKGAPWGTHLIRAALGVFAVLCGFYAMTRLPLSESMALTYTAPLLVAIIGRAALKEYAPPLRWLAIGCGFTGMLILCRPRIDGEICPVIVLLTGSVFRATSDILARILSRSSSDSAIVLAFLFLGSLLGAPFAVAFWQTPTISQTIALAFIGVCGGFFQLYLTKAYRLTPPSGLAPFLYTSLLWSSLMGWFVFDEAPSKEELIGSALIVLDGCLAFWTFQQTPPAVRDASTAQHKRKEL